MSKIKKRNDIQGLRAIAVISVIAYHMQNDFLPGGFIGVDVFFVISGFLITSIILKEKEDNSFSFVGFYWSRAKRILPAYCFFLLVASLLISVIVTSKDYMYFGQSLKSALYFNSNNYFSGFGDYFAPSSYELPLLHTWSLSIEMQYYLLLPILLIIVPCKYLKVTIIVIFVLTYLSLLNFQVGGYFSIVSRIPEFLIGSWVAIVKKPKKLPIKLSNLIVTLAALVLIGCLIFINKDSNFPGVIVLLPCVSAATIIYLKNSYINRTLSHRLLVWIGALSYSLYLWHWLVLAIARYWSGEYQINASLIPGLLLIMFSISCFSYYFVENIPKRKLNRSKKHTFIFLILVGGTCIFTVTVAPLINSILSVQLPVTHTRYADSTTICHGQIIGECLRGDLSGDPILLIGDSHAAQLNIASDIFGEINKQALKVITASTSSCVTIPDFDYERLPKWAQQACINQIGKVSALLPEYNKIIIAGMWSHHSLSDKFLISLENFLFKANKKGKKVIVLGQIPLLNHDIKRVVRFDGFGLKPDVEIDPIYAITNKKIKSISKKYSNVEFVDVSKLKMFSTAPRYSGDIIYHDKSHLNEIGSMHYGEEIAPYLNNL